jgi:hypothetical protein
MINSKSKWILKFRDKPKLESKKFSILDTVLVLPETPENHVDQNHTENYEPMLLRQNEKYFFVVCN